MILIVRGIVWYGFYLFLLLLPLLTAALSNPERAAQSFLVEVAVAAGFIGFSIMSLEFALISRINRCCTAVWRGCAATIPQYNGHSCPGFYAGSPHICSSFPAIRQAAG